MKMDLQQNDEDIIDYSPNDVLGDDVVVKTIYLTMER
jgi:hypothetical protein